MTQRSGSIPNVIYDRDVDVLYLKYMSNKNALAKEIGGHIIAYFDSDTGMPTTITIIDFQWLERNDKSWRKNLPIPVNFEKDVIPYL